MTSLIQKLRDATSDDAIDEILCDIEHKAEAAEARMEKALQAYLNSPDKKSVRAFREYQDAFRETVELSLVGDALCGPESSIMWQMGCLNAWRERSWSEGRNQSEMQRILQLEESVRTLSAALYSLMALIQRPALLSALEGES